MPTETQTAPSSTVLNQAEPKKEELNVTVRVQKMVTQFMDKGTLRLPADYSPENALKSAWLTLQTCVDRDRNPVLQSCTQVSVINALLDMIVQGLNPAKKQCYFIAYGKALVCQRSYFGDIALAQRVRPGLEVYSGVVYEGDEFSYEIYRGRKTVTHRQKLENINPAKIIAAYCGLIDENGEDLGAEVMPWAQIQKSWGMSKTYKAGSGTHADFPDQMALRTVIRRRCKPIINQSNDALLRDSVRRQEAEALENEMDDEVATLGNGQIITIEPIHEGEIVQPEEEATPSDPNGDPGY